MRRRKISGSGSLARATATPPSISLDYAIVEKASNIVCVPLYAWSDVGSWSSCGTFLRRTATGQCRRGEKAKVLLEKASRQSTPIAIRACRRPGRRREFGGGGDGRCGAWWLQGQRRSYQSVSSTTSRGTAKDIALHHNRVYRPWGWYQGLDNRVTAIRSNASW